MVRVVLALLSPVAALALSIPPASGAPLAAPSVASGAGASGATLVLEPAPGTTLTVDGRPYAGDLVSAPSGGGVAVVDRVAFERYVEGIAEMPSSWPAAALQAQAVAARTYALWTVLTHRPGPAGGQICATDDCQVYSGLDKPAGPDGAAWVAAVRATRGDVLQYGGRVIESLYGSSDGGQTLYGGVPWLPSVSDPQDALAPEHQWSWSAPLARLAGVIDVPAGRTLVGLVSSAHAITETLRAADGSTSTAALSPDSFHSLVDSGMAAPAGLDLPLPSYRYSVSTYGDSVRVEGWGDGNGLGLSQYGALGKAEAGWSSGAILATYYAGTAVAPLPAGEMPATISVTLVPAAPSAVIGATGPARIVDGSGRTVVTTAGPGVWSVDASAGGVTLTPVSGVPVAAPVPAPDQTAPVAPRMSAPAGAATGAPPPPVPTTTPPTTGPPPTTVAAANRSARPSPPPTVTAAAVGGRSGRRSWAPAAILLLTAAGGAVAATAGTRRRVGQRLLRSLRARGRAT